MEWLGFFGIFLLTPNSTGADFALTWGYHAQTAGNTDEVAVTHCRRCVFLDSLWGLPARVKSSDTRTRWGDIDLNYKLRNLLARFGNMGGREPCKRANPNSAHTLHLAEAHKT